VLAAIILLASLISLTACNKTVASKPQVIKLDYAYYNPVSLVLKEKHFLEDDLAKDGVSVEWTLSQ
jgi:sulfonate transport system substrate-binding protein